MFRIWTFHGWVHDHESKAYTMPKSMNENAQLQFLLADVHD